MSLQYDVAIIGAGAMGSAAAYHLSATGKKILVIDQFAPPHQMGSSHGQSRIIREAYFESPLYVPLVQQAYTLWYELEKNYGKQLLLKTGGLMLGNAGSKVFEGAERSAAAFNIWYEVLQGNEIKKKFPAFRPLPGTIALYEKNAGILFPEECIKAHITLAQKSNTSFCFNEKVNAVNTENDAVQIITDKGAYYAEKLIITAGAWLNTLLPGLKLPLSVARQVLCWFNYQSSQPENFMPGKFPVYIWEYGAGRMFYGFPSLENKLKIAIHHEGKDTTADTVNRTVNSDEIEDIIAIAEKFLDAKLSFNHAAVCMYTNTPSEDFIIDYHPHHQNIIIASPCSGHGFKFSSAIGKVLSDMACDKKPFFSSEAFSIKKHI